MIFLFYSDGSFDQQTNNKDNDDLWKSANKGDFVVKSKDWGHRRTSDFRQSIDTAKEMKNDSFYTETFLNNLTATQIQRIDVNLYLQICQDNPQKEFIKQYIHWYLLKDQSHFMTNELQDEVHFSFKMARFSPTQTHIVTACHDKSLIVWDYSKTGNVHMPLKIHKAKILCLAYSNKGNKVASINKKNIFVIWDIETSSQNNLLTCEGLKEPIGNMVFSNDDSKIALGSKEGNLSVWDANSGQLLIGPLKGHESKIKAIVFSPDNLMVCTGGKDKIILLWDMTTEQILKRLKGHRNEVFTVAFNVIGDRIISGGKDKNVLVWDVAKGHELFDPLKGHKNAVTVIAVSPDGLRFASGGADKMIIIWDGALGQIIAGPLEGHDKKIEDLRYSKDGDRLFSVSCDNTVIIWDSHKGIIIKKPLQSYPLASKIRTITPNGLFMIVANGKKEENDSTFSVWNSLTAEPISRSIKGHTDAIKAIACSHNSKLIVTGGKDKKIIVWNLEKTNEALYGPFDGHTEEITVLAYSPDSKTFASGSKNAEIKVWDTFKGCPHPFDFTGHRGKINILKFCSEGTKFMSGGFDHNVNVWGTQNGKNLLNYTHEAPITAVTFSYDTLSVASGSEDGQMMIWRLDGSEALPLSIKADLEGVTYLVFSHDGKKIATAANSVAQIKIWNIGKEIVLFIGPLLGHHFPIYRLNFSKDDSFLYSNSSDCNKTWKIWCVNSEKTFPIEYTFDVSPDGQYIVAPGKESTDIFIYDSLKGQAIYHILRSHLLKVNFANFSYDSQTMISGSDDCSLMVWDIKTGKPSLGPLKGHVAPVYVGIFSHNGQKIASAGNDKTIIIWNGQTGKPLYEPLVGHNDDVYTMDFSSDDYRLVSGGDDGKIIVWDALNGNKLYEPIEAHEDWITCVKFSGDGLRIYSSSFDTTIKVWNSENGEQIDTLPGHTQSVYSLKFSPDHTKMISGSNDQRIIIWDSISQSNCKFSRESKFKCGVKAVHWSTNDDLFVVFDEYIKCYFNYFSNEEIFFSRGLILSDFYRDPEKFTDKEFMNILNGTIGEIVPFYYTFLHAVAYTDDHQRFFQNRILKLLKIKGKSIDFAAFFKKDIHNNSCVDIILKKNNKNLIRIIFKYIAKTYNPSDVYHQGFVDKITLSLLYQILMIFGNDTSLIIKLIDMCFDCPIDFPDLYNHKGFENSFFLSIEEPKVNAVKLENIIKEEEIKIKTWYKKLIETKNPFPTQEIIMAKTLFLKDILSVNKGVALDFFRKISSLESDNPIFNNETFQKIIHYKWETYAKKIYFTEAAWFLVMMIFYVTNANFILPLRVGDNGLEDKIWDFVSLIIDIFIFLFVFRNAYKEILQMFAFGFLEYFLSLWNYIDIGLIVMILVVLGFDVSTIFDIYTNFEFLKVLHACVIFMLFIRLISFARGVSGTSFMIRLVIQVIIDIRSFLFLTLSFILALAFSTYMLQTELTDDHFSSFNTFFRMMLGDLTNYDELVVDYYYVLWIFFFLGSIVLSIVLLNLLISIISDTFGAVKSNENLARHYEMCNIIYDLDAELIIDKPIQYYTFVYAEGSSKDGMDQMAQLKDKLALNSQMVKNIDYNLKLVLNKGIYATNSTTKKKK